MTVAVVTADAPPTAASDVTRVFDVASVWGVRVSGCRRASVGRAVRGLDKIHDEGRGIGTYGFYVDLCPKSRHARIG
jgi:hypothetical protein